MERHLTLWHLRSLSNDINPDAPPPKVRSAMRQMTELRRPSCALRANARAKFEECADFDSRRAFALKNLLSIGIKFRFSDLSRCTRKRKRSFPFRVRNFDNGPASAHGQRLHRFQLCL